MTAPKFEGDKVQAVFLVAADGSAQMATPNSAANPSYVSTVETAPVPLSFQQIAPVASSPIVSPGAATRAIISTTGADIRYVIGGTNGTTPTASVGNYLPTGKELILVGAANIAAFRCIQVTATASVNVQLF